MRADDLRKQFDMQGHEENGMYMECHYVYNGTGRAASGSSLFYTAAGEKTKFHRIDCDEYWCYNAGSDIEVWLIDQKGKLTIQMLGMGKDAMPVVFIPKGTIFASKHQDLVDDGTFFTCITIPRFDYRGFELLEDEDVFAICPEAKEF